MEKEILCFPVVEVWLIVMLSTSLYILCVFMELCYNSFPKPTHRIEAEEGVVTDALSLDPHK